MRKIIHRLRKQPENVRRQILNVVIFVFALILLLLWSFSLGRTLGSEETEKQVKEDLKPFSLLKNSIFQK